MYISNSKIKFEPPFLESTDPIQTDISDTAIDTESATLTESETSTITNIEKIINKTIKEFLENITKWVSSILTLGIPQDNESFSKITQTINLVSEVIFHCRLNIHQSTEGHLYVSKQPFTKFKKLNYKNKHPTT